MLQVVFYS